MGADKEFENWIEGNWTIPLSHNEYFRVQADENLSMVWQRQGKFLFPIWHGIPILWRMRKIIWNTNLKISEIICWTFQNLASQNWMHHQLLIRLDLTGYGIHTAGWLMLFLSAYIPESLLTKKSWIASWKFPKPKLENYPWWFIQTEILPELPDSFSLFTDIVHIQCQFSRKICCLKEICQRIQFAGTHPPETPFQNTISNKSRLRKQLATQRRLMTWKKSLQKPVWNKTTDAYCIYSNIQVNWSSRESNTPSDPAINLNVLHFHGRLAEIKNSRKWIWRVKADFQPQKNTTILRKLVKREQINQASGSTTLGVKLFGRLSVERRFNIRAF